MANKFSGIIEEKSVSTTNGATLYKFRVGGQTYSVYSNRLAPDAQEIVNALQRGDEVEGEYVQATSKTGRTYFNLTSIVKVERVGQPAGKPYQAQDSQSKLRSVALSYAKDGWCAGKIEASEITAYADQFLAYISGPAEDEAGEI